MVVGVIRDKGFLTFITKKCFHCLCESLSCQVIGKAPQSTFANFYKGLSFSVGNFSVWE